MMLKAAACIPASCKASLRIKRTRARKDRDQADRGHEVGATSSYENATDANNKAAGCAPMPLLPLSIASRGEGALSMAVLFQ